MADQHFEVAPENDPLAGLEGEERKKATVELVRRVAEFLESDEGLSAKRISEGTPWEFSVDPGVVSAKTGAEFPVAEVLIRHRNGDPIEVYEWGGQDRILPRPVVVTFVDCTFFDEDSEFFGKLAKTLGSERVVFGILTMF